METTFESGGIDIRQGYTTTRHKLLLELVLARDVKDMIGEHCSHAIETLSAHLRPTHVAPYAHIIQEIYPQTTVETLGIYALHLFLGMA